MIRVDQYPQALRALQRLIVHAKGRAYEAGQTGVAEFLNDVELLPEFLAADGDQTSEFVELLQGIAQMDPSCRYIVEEFEGVSTKAAEW